MTSTFCWADDVVDNVVDNVEGGWTTVSKPQKKKKTDKVIRQDLYIKCKECKFYFDLSEEEHFNYLNKGLVVPKTCKECIERRHEKSIKKV